jgi:HPt (histidine-containing phosphotransfer) domain-containing protein
VGESPAAGEVSGGPHGLAEADAIDYPQLQQRLRGREAVIQSVLALFPDECRSSLRELEQHIRSHDWEQAADVAHRIKGAAGTISAHALRAAAIVVEEACRQEQPQVVQTALLDLFHESTRTVDHVKSILTTPSTEHGRSGGSACTY